MSTTTIMFYNVENIKCNKIQDGDTKQETVLNMQRYVESGAFSKIIPIFLTLLFQTNLTVASSDVGGRQKTKMAAR